jgi:hypothetical protein
VGRGRARWCVYRRTSSVRSFAAASRLPARSSDSAASANCVLSSETAFPLSRTVKPTWCSALELDRLLLGVEEEEEPCGI